ncbi:MAG: VWA domain-containing protein [Acidobacteriota bacterium]
MIAFAFEAPAFLLALALLVPYGVWRWRRVTRGAVEHPPLQHPPPELRRSSRRWRRAGVGVGVEVALLALVVVGLAGPYRGADFELIEPEGIDVMLVLDISASMLAQDFEPDRITALRRLAAEFVGRAGGHRIGIVIFAGDAFVQCPLTMDRVTLGALLDGVDVEAISHGKSGGTAVGDALLLAEHRLAQRRIDGRDQAIVLITDGDSNLGVDPLLAARRVKESGIRPYFIGVGGLEPMTVVFRGEMLMNDEVTPYRTSLDDEKLRALAEASGGRYDRAVDAGALEAILADLSRLESAPLATRRLERRVSLVWLPSLAALTLLGVHVAAPRRRPWR